MIYSRAMKSQLVSIVAAVLLAGCTTTLKKPVQAPDIPIHEAFKAGNIGAVKQHLAAGTDVNAKGPNAGLTPLHRAAYYGLEEIVELLLAKGADLNAREEIGWTPLHYAAAMRHKEIVELLLARGADVHAKDDGGDTPLDAVRSGNDEGIADLLRRHGGKTSPDDPDLGGTDRILNESPVDLGYTNVPNWLKFPPADHQNWEFDGDVVGVGVDSKDNVYVSHRGDHAPRLTVWKPDGSLLRVFPCPKTKRPHMVNVDKDDNVWLVDDGNHCIYKMNQKGEVLLTLGEPGVKGFDNDHFNHCSDVGWDPSGNLYVTDGGTTTPRPKNRRVLKYDKFGKFIRKWGSIGHAVGQFDYGHSVFVDSKGTVFVCDRNNWRIQVFDEDGNQEANWTHIGRVYKICEDNNGDYFVSDGKNGRITKFRRDGSVIGFFETPDKEPGARGGLINAHSIAICRNGDLITGTFQGWVERWKAPGTD